MSNYNKILFKKRIIGKINGKNIEIGATEPCVILVFKQSRRSKNRVKYISPKLNGFTEKFECIHFTEKDVTEIEQNDFITDDFLWRVLVNGDFEDYKLIKEILVIKNGINIECRSGFQPKKDMKSLGESAFKELITPKDFQRYRIINQLDKFDWNQKLRRRPRENIFNDSRIIVPVRPLKSHKIRFKGIRLEKEVIHKDDVVSIKIKEKEKYIDNLAPYLALINSKLLGYYFFHISTQWGKGEGKRATIRNNDIEKLPLFDFKTRIKDKKKLIGLVKQIEKGDKNSSDIKTIENEIDELVFDLYRLLDYEKVFKVNYFVPSTTIIIPERYHENDVTEGARRATGVTSFFQRFLTSFAFSFS